MALNDIIVLKEQADGSHRETVLNKAELKSIAAPGGSIAYDGLGDAAYGPFSILQNYNQIFQNSGYTPGIAVGSTPASFGFFPVGNASCTVNPGDLFGYSQAYRIRVTARVTGAFNDGLHCLLRRVIIGGAEESVSGLLDFGSGNLQIYHGVSNPLTTASSAAFSAWEYYRIYFAAYNGGNGATVQDVTLTLQRATL